MIIAVTGHADSYKKAFAALEEIPDTVPMLRELEFAEVTEVAQHVEINAKRNKGKKIVILGFAHADMSQRERVLCSLADYTIVGSSGAALVRMLHRIINPPAIDRSNPRHVRPL